MIKTLDWELTERIAKGMTDAMLEWSIKDAMECVELKIDEGYYLDQISVYRTEQRRRNERAIKARKANNKKAGA